MKYAVTFIFVPHSRINFTDKCNIKLTQLSHFLTNWLYTKQRNDIYISKLSLENLLKMKLNLHSSATFHKPNNESKNCQNLFYLY